MRSSRDLIPVVYLGKLCEHCDTIQSVFITARVAHRRCKTAKLNKR